MLCEWRGVNRKSNGLNRSLRGNGPFWGEERERRFVVRVGLDAECAAEDELPNGGCKSMSQNSRVSAVLVEIKYRGGLPCDEGVEGVVGDGEAVDELDDSGEHEEEHEAVDEFQACRGCPGRDD